nr:MAG TPA: hypothetical protein [Bacteriophage sp.]
MRYRIRIYVRTFLGKMEPLCKADSSWCYGTILR